jgi:hypothetical protein
MSRRRWKDQVYSNKHGTLLAAVSPGTGAIDGTVPDEAERNIVALVEECFETPSQIKVERRSALDKDGRYAFDLRRGERSCQVLMPGLPLDEVHYVTGYNPWNFPRLYVDGSSYLWSFALAPIRRALAQQDGGDDAD